MMMDKLDNPPPENIFRMPKNWLLVRNLARAVLSMPGIGIEERSLKTISAKKTNSTFFLRDASVHISFILLKKFCISLFYLNFLSFDTESGPYLLEALDLAFLGRKFILGYHHGLPERLKLISAVLWKLFYNVAKFRAPLVAGPCCLPLSSAPASFSVLASTAHDAVFLIFMFSF